jgi:hypothetical protein
MVFICLMLAPCWCDWQTNDVIFLISRRFVLEWALGNSLRQSLPSRAGEIPREAADFLSGCRSIGWSGMQAPTELPTDMAT